jgi:hypothetical protein
VTSTRRHFLQASAAMGLGPWAALVPFGPATAQEAQVTPNLVRFSPDIEPIVRLIEETPRDKCVAAVIEQLRKGLPYRNLLAALYLANVRTGIINHPLAVLHSTDQMTLDLPLAERLLPTLWALDSYKFHQARGPEEFSPKLKTLSGKLPTADQADRELTAAMDAFDADRAERAIAVLVRTQGAARVMEPLWHYAARDWTFIGHFAIWAANGCRVLSTIGWQYAEPALRVVTTNLVGEDKTLQRQPYHANRERAGRAKGKLPANWAEAEGEAGLTSDLLVLIREQKADEACELAVERLVAGKANAGAIWDAVHLSAGEMIMCAQKNSEPLHANTAANALHYAFQASGQGETRLLIVLQAIGWMCLYRAALVRKNWLREPTQINELAAAKIPDRPDEAIEEILAHLSFGPGNPTSDPVQGIKGQEFNSQPWRHEAAGKVFAFHKKHGDAGSLVRAAYRLLPLKADWDPHRIKFPIAAAENIGWVSPPWRPHLLAAASYSFLGADALDTDLAKQVREAVPGL